MPATVSLSSHGKATHRSKSAEFAVSKVAVLAFAAAGSLTTGQRRRTFQSSLSSAVCCFKLAVAECCYAPEPNSISVSTLGPTLLGPTLLEPTLLQPALICHQNPFCRQTGRLLGGHRRHAPKKNMQHRSNHGCGAAKGVEASTVGRGTVEAVCAMQLGPALVALAEAAECRRALELA